MNIRHLISATALTAAALLLCPQPSSAAMALTPSLQSFIGGTPTQFDTPEAAVSAFKDALAKDDLAAIAGLLGLDPGKLKSADGIADRLGEMRAAAAKLVSVSPDGDRRTISLGTEVWPFPFPLVKNATDGKWAFDPQAGVQEIANRRPAAFYPGAVAFPSARRCRRRGSVFKFELELIVRSMLKRAGVDVAIDDTDATDGKDPEGGWFRRGHLRLAARIFVADARFASRSPAMGVSA